MGSRESCDYIYRYYDDPVVDGFAVAGCGKWRESSNLLTVIDSIVRTHANDLHTFDDLISIYKENVTVTRRVIKTQEYRVDNMDIYGEKRKEKIK